MSGRTFATVSAAALAIALAGCGSSSSGGQIELAPSAGATQVSIPTTPKPPPALRTKPTVTVSPSDCSTKQLVKKDLVDGSGQEALAGQVRNDFDGVFRQVVRVRLEHALREGFSLFPETVGLWNAVR